MLEMGRARARLTTLFRSPLRDAHLPSPFASLFACYRLVGLVGNGPRQSDRVYGSIREPLFACPSLPSRTSHSRSLLLYLFIRILSLSHPTDHLFILSIRPFQLYSFIIPHSLSLSCLLHCKSSTSISLPPPALSIQTYIASLSLSSIKHRLTDRCTSVPVQNQKSKLTRTFVYLSTDSLSSPRSTRDHHQAQLDIHSTKLPPRSSP